MQIRQISKHPFVKTIFLLDWLFNLFKRVFKVQILDSPISPTRWRYASLMISSSISISETVDVIVSFDEDTPETLIRSIKPDVLVKGADYKGKFIAGADYVKTNGGEVVLIPILEGTTITTYDNLPPSCE